MNNLASNLQDSQLKNNLGVSMVANPTDRIIEIYLDRNIYRLTPPVRLREPADFPGWTEKLLENLARCPHPGAEMLETVQCLCLWRR